MAIADKKKKNNAPDIRRERRNILNEKTPFSIVEEYKLLRTNIMFSLAKDGCRKVAFTSANMSEGKSISVINTSITFAEMDFPSDMFALVNATFLHPSFVSENMMFVLRSLYSSTIEKAVFSLRMFLLSRLISGALLFFFLSLVAM